MLSARNQIAATVTSVRTDGLMAEVVVQAGDVELEMWELWCGQGEEQSQQ